MKIYYNANIFAPDHPGSTAFVVDHGRFIAFGTDEDILNGFSNTVQQINLNRKTIWPGLTDAHVHLYHLANSMAMVDCETDSLDACLERIRQAAVRLPANAWVRGHGWNQNRWESGYGTAAMLDQVCDGRPAYLTAKSLHAAWANSQALNLAGITQSIPDPPDGALQKDEQGRLTGILFESGGMALVERVIPPDSHAEVTSKIKSLIPSLWQHGLVGVHDFDGIQCWKALQELYQKGELQIRVRKNVPRDLIDTFIESGYRTDHGDDWLNIGGIKLFADGALGPQTAAMLTPYENTETAGTLLMNQAEIEEIGKFASSNGFALAIHAIGDLANHVVLNAYQTIRLFEQTKNLPHYRHRIEHVQIIDPKDLPRLAQLHIIASVQPVHAPSDMEMADKYLGSRAQNAYAYQAMVDSDAELVCGSDAPVEPINPFQGIHAAITRRKINGQPGENGWYPEQRLTLQDALAGFSSKPAEISNRGSWLGKIATGYKADFIILQEDPFTIDPHCVAEIRPIATFAEGKRVYLSETADADY